MSVTDLGLLRFISDERDLILISGDASSRIGVDNRGYHYVSQSEIAGAKRISRHLFGSVLLEAQVLTVTVSRAL